MKILLQFPEGLKQIALQEQKKLEKSGNIIYISASPCYGACDLALDEARHLKVDKLIHFGHADFGVKVDDLQVEYKECRIRVDVEKALEKVLPALKQYKKIGLVTTVQHLDQIDEMKEFLEKSGKEVVIGKPTGHSKYNGQLLGCDSTVIQSTEKLIDCILYFGSGKFHPGAIKTEKPIITVSSIGDFAFYDQKTWEKKRNGALMAAYSAKKFGILLSTKPGQYFPQLAEKAKEQLEKNGKEASILVANELAPEQLNNFMTFDAYVNTACPRIVDDWEEFGKPILNFDDLTRLLNLMAANSKI